MKLLQLLIFIVGKLTISAIYNLYFHPLRDFPGPKLAAATPLPFVWRLINGRFPAWTNELHAKYGVVVRVHPDELSFIGSSAWRDIYLARPELPKPTFGVLETPNGVPSIVTIPDPDTHGRQRKIIGHAFSDRALREQEYILQRYSDLLVTRLQHQIKGVKDAQQVNIFDWYNFTTFDVLGDLCFGDSFHCLEEGDNHPWVSEPFVPQFPCSLSFHSTQMFAHNELPLPKMKPMTCIRGNGSGLRPSSLAFTRAFKSLAFVQWFHANTV